MFRVGPADDAAELDADRVAADVVRGLSQRGNNVFARAEVGDRLPLADPARPTRIRRATFDLPRDLAVSAEPRDRGSWEGGGRVRRRTTKSWSVPGVATWATTPL